MPGGSEYRQTYIHKTAHTYENSTRHNTSKMTLPSKYSDNLQKHRRNSNTEYTPSNTEYTPSNTELSLELPGNAPAPTSLY
jgi:hypothetical protein